MIRLQLLAAFLSLGKDLLLLSRDKAGGLRALLISSTLNADLQLPVREVHQSSARGRALPPGPGSLSNPSLSSRKARPPASRSWLGLPRHRVRVCAEGNPSGVDALSQTLFCACLPLSPPPAATTTTTGITGELQPSTENTAASLYALTHYSPFGTTAELLKQCHRIQDHGTILMVMNPRASLTLSTQPGADITATEPAFTGDHVRPCHAGETPAVRGGVIGPPAAGGMQCASLREALACAYVSSPCRMYVNGVPVVTQHPYGSLYR